MRRRSELADGPTVALRTHNKMKEEIDKRSKTSKKRRLQGAQQQVPSHPETDAMRSWKPLLAALVSTQAGS